MERKIKTFILFNVLTEKMCLRWFLDLSATVEDADLVRILVNCSTHTPNVTLSGGEGSLAEKEGKKSQQYHVFTFKTHAARVRQRGLLLKLYFCKELTEILEG